MYVLLSAENSRRVRSPYDDEMAEMLVAWLREEGYVDSSLPLQQDIGVLRPRG